jgi:hypothetical protein
MPLDINHLAHQHQDAFWHPTCNRHSGARVIGAQVLKEKASQIRRRVSAGRLSDSAQLSLPFQGTQI